LFKICIKRTNQTRNRQLMGQRRKKQWKSIVISRHIKNSQHVSQYVGQQLYYLKSSNKKRTWVLTNLKVSWTRNKKMKHKPHSCCSNRKKWNVEHYMQIVGRKTYVDPLTLNWWRVKWH
jgi:hypothetical protein